MCCLLHFVQLFRRGRRKYAVFGAFLMHLILGTFYTFGNMNPYITSYLKHYTNQDITYSDTMWIFVSLAFCWGLGASFGGYLDQWLGLTVTCSFSAALVCWGVLLTFITIQVGNYGVLLTYGLMYGLGIGVGYTVSLSAAMSWYPDHEGVVSGIVLSGFGAAPILFDFLQTLYINPQNKKPDVNEMKEGYFSDVSVLNRVPNAMLLFGGVYAGALVLAICLLRKKTGSQYAWLLHVSSTDSDLATINLTPFQMMRTRNFYILWICMILNASSTQVVTSLYKAFGCSLNDTDINNDKFLAIIGSLSGGSNMLCRLFWGLLCDYCSYKKLMAVQTVGMCLLLMSFYYITVYGRHAFSFWLIFMNVFIAGNFSLFPSIVSKIFGAENRAANYGIVFSGVTLASILTGILSSVTKNFDPAAWRLVFVISSMGCLLSFVVNVFFDSKPDYSHFIPQELTTSSGTNSTNHVMGASNEHHYEPLIVSISLTPKTSAS